MSSSTRNARVAALVATALAVSLAPVAAAQAEPSIAVRQEDHPEDDCARFFVDVRHAGSPVVTVEIWKHRGGTAPDLKLFEEEVAGEPEEDGDGFRVEAGPYDRETTLNATLDLYVVASWRGAEGFRSVTSDFFDLACPGGPAPRLDCPAHVEAEALDDGPIRLT